MLQYKDMVQCKKEMLVKKFYCALCNKHIEEIPVSLVKRQEDAQLTVLCCKKCFNKYENKHGWETDNVAT